MSIAFNEAVTLSSVTLKDIVINEATNEAIIIESTGPTLRRYTMAAGKAQQGSNVTILAGAASLTLVSSSSAFIMSNTSSSTCVDLVELTTGYRQNYNIGAARRTFEATRGQQSAGDISTKYVVATTVTATTVLIFNGNTFTFTHSAPSSIGNDLVTTVLLKSSNRWLLGTDGGKVVEIDETGATKKLLYVTYPGVSSLGSEIPSISGLAYHNDILMVLTQQGYLMIYSYSTNELLHVQYVNESSGSTSGGSPLCASSSGECVMGFNFATTPNKTIAELNLTATPWPCQDLLYSDSVGIIPAYAINSTTGRGAFLQQTVNKVQFFDLTPQYTNTFATVIQDPPGTPVEGRIIRLDNSGGVGTAKVIQDMVISNQSTNTTLPTGKNIIDIAITGSGVVSKFSVSNYNT